MIGGTSGVKIDKKTVDLGDHAVSLIPWEVAGEDDISSPRMGYLRGCTGYMLVANGTRPSTLGIALSLRERLAADHDHLPFELLLIKSDQHEQRAIGNAELDNLRQPGWSVHSSGPRIGEGVGDAFRDLAVRVGARQ
jgi:hypothetical protein